MAHYRYGGRSGILAVPATAPDWSPPRSAGTRPWPAAASSPTGGSWWRETVASGWWSQLAPEVVVIPASFGYANGVRFKVKQGFRGLLAHNRRGAPVVFMLTQPTTRYYEIMCRAGWMPVLVDEVI
jgi:hypothetical protein